jgi:hypothetical protein
MVYKNLSKSKGFCWIFRTATFFLTLLCGALFLHHSPAWPGPSFQAAFVPEGTEDHGDEL